MYVLVCVLVAGKSLEINHMTLHLQNQDFQLKATGG